MPCEQKKYPLQRTRLGCGKYWVVFCKKPRTLLFEKKGYLPSGEPAGKAIRAGTPKPSAGTGFQWSNLKKD